MQGAAGGPGPDQGAVGEGVVDEGRGGPADGDGLPRARGHLRLHAHEAADHADRVRTVVGGEVVAVQAVAQHLRPRQPHGVHPVLSSR